LLQGVTREKAAEAAGVNVATLYRWQNKAEFQEALLEAQNEAFGQTMRRLQQQGAPTAADILLGIMTNPDEPAGARVQAAKCVIAQSRQTSELHDLKLRLAKLEKLQTTAAVRSADKEGYMPAQGPDRELCPKVPEGVLLKQIRVLLETLE
jgi:AcrR family transcriptional regulator